MTQDITDYELCMSHEQAQELRDAGWVDPNEAESVRSLKWRMRSDGWLDPSEAARLLRDYGPTEALEAAFALLDAFATDRSGDCQRCDHDIRSVARDKQSEELLCLWCVMEAAYRMGFDARRDG